MRVSGFSNVCGTHWEARVGFLATLCSVGSLEQGSLGRGSSAGVGKIGQCSKKEGKHFKGPVSSLTLTTSPALLSLSAVLGVVLDTFVLLDAHITTCKPTGFRVIIHRGRTC